MGSSGRKFFTITLTILLPLAIFGFLIVTKGNSLIQKQQGQIDTLTNPQNMANNVSNLATPTPAPDAMANSQESPQTNLLGTSSAKLDPATMTTPPPMQIDQNKKYSATLKTSVGDIVVELKAKQTPVTVNNFVFLANNNFYNNTIFHRVIKGFMIQGGDPKGDGTGGPGYKFNDEPFTGEYTRGTIAMANAGPNTNGSQFFIMHQDTPLPKNYVIFGKVSSGLDVVDKIANSQVTTSPSGENSKPVNPEKILSIQITEQ